MDRRAVRPTDSGRDGRSAGAARKAETIGANGRRDRRRRGEYMSLTLRTADTIHPQHFGWAVKNRVATITLNRPERKNPLTFESYAELRNLFRDLVYVSEVRAVVISGSGGNFCSGGDV